MFAAVASSIAPERTPPSLHFSEATPQLDYFELLPAALIAFTEPFTSDTGQLTTSGVSPGSVTISGGQCTVVHGPGSASNFEKFAGQAELTMPQLFTQIDIVSMTGSARVGVGCMIDTTHYLLARWSKVDTNFTIRLVDGATDVALFAVSYSSTNLIKLGLSVVGNSCCLWYDNGGGWTLGTSGDVTSSVDLKSKLQSGNGYKPAFTVTSNGSATVVLDNYKIGRFGAVGVRDIEAVTTEDGTPSISGNVVTVTATAVDAAGSGYMGVFAIDLVAHTASQVGVVMVNRSSKVQNDLAGQIIWNGADSRLLISTWGNGFSSTLEVLHKLETGVDLRSGSHIVASMSTLALPELNGVSNSGRYDPFTLKKNGTWYVGYTAVTNTNFSGSPFYAALASTPDFSAWTAIGADSGHTGYEGTKLLEADDRIWNLAGGHTTIRIYDAANAYVEDLDATTDGGSDTYPHPMVVAFGTKQVLLTFDKDKFGSANFTWGDVRFYEARRYK